MSFAFRSALGVPGRFGHITWSADVTQWTVGVRTLVFHMWLVGFCWRAGLKEGESLIVQRRQKNVELLSSHTWWEPVVTSSFFHYKNSRNQVSRSLRWRPIAWSRENKRSRFFFIGADDHQRGGRLEPGLHIFIKAWQAPTRLTVSPMRRGLLREVLQGNEEIGALKKIALRFKCMLSRISPPPPTDWNSKILDREFLVSAIAFRHCLN